MDVAILVTVPPKRHQKLLEMPPMSSLFPLAASLEKTKPSSLALRTRIIALHFFNQTFRERNTEFC